MPEIMWSLYRVSLHLYRGSWPDPGLKECPYATPSDRIFWAKSLSYLELVSIPSVEIKMALMDGFL